MTVGYYFGSCSSSCLSTVGSSQVWVPPWDDGIRYRTELVSVDEDFLALSVPFVADRILRAKTDSVEYDLIETYIRAATELCEQETQSYVRPVTLRQYMSGFPSGPIRLEGTPLLDFLSISSYDANGVLQEYDVGSPHTYVVTPSGVNGRATVQLGSGQAWPTLSLTREDAVVLEYTAGYADADSVPQLLKTGIGLVVAELYKNPDLSNDLGQVGNTLTLGRFWPRRF